MSRLVINADDLGLHPRIDEGIFRAHRDGVLTSATVLVTGPNAVEASARAREQGLATGLHLCLSGGLPAAAKGRVPSLAPGGTFRRAWHEVIRALAMNDIDHEEIGIELRAQVERARALGVKVDHFDMHQHLHLFPGIGAEVRAIAQEEGVPLRWPAALPRPFFALEAASLREETSAWLKTAVLAALGAVNRPARHVHGLGVQQAGRMTEARLLEVLGQLAPDETCELGCHPGLHPGVVPEDPLWQYQWEAELDALCSPRVREHIERCGIELTTYGALFAT